MDTKLKKNKMTRAWIYRAVSFGLLIMTVMSLTTGHKALEEIFVNENYQLLWGDVTGVTEFQKCIGETYNNGMIAFAGPGDDEGYPLRDDGNKSIQDQATVQFYNTVAEAGGELLYYVYDYNYKPVEDEYGNALHTNFEQPIISEHDGHLNLPDGVKLLYYHNGPKHQLTSNGYLKKDVLEFSYLPNGKKAQELDFLLAVRESGDVPREGLIGQFEQQALDYRDQLRFMIACVTALVVSWVLCLVSFKAGRTAKREVTKWTYRILPEIKIILLIVLFMQIFPYFRHPLTMVGEKALLKIGFFALLMYPVFSDLKYNSHRYFKNSLPVLCYRYVHDWGQGQTWKKRLSTYIGVTGGGAVACGAVAGILILNLQNTIKNTMDALVLQGFFSPLSDPKGSGYRVLLAVCWLIFIAVALLCISLYFAFQFMKEAMAVTDKISDIRKGNLKEPLTTDNYQYLKQTVEDVNQLESGIENVVDQKSRADRMKVELITNVSHDLKTPLTSIINYADLLCDEEMSPAARDYVTALREKSYKLKDMVQDVFEVSKASTGNLHVEIAVLDLAKLLRQTLADMDEKIQESNLTFKTDLPGEPVYIKGDGDKIYRIFQNLFVNAIQYSLDYSRVHVGLHVEDGVAVATVKNTSRGELNFDASEITERFVRADASRSSEGSGLGLSIAESFAQACGGEFSISTDADMFTATVSFPVAENPVSREENQGVEESENMI